MSAPSWLQEFETGLAELEQAHLTRHRRLVEPESGARLKVNGQSMLAFCSNNYLGLAQHPELIAAACTTAQALGVGAGASPMVSGHSPANEALEHALARFVGMPSALYFYAGYAANAGLVPALVGPGDAIFSDALNHACLIDGARLSGAAIHRYAHANVAELALALAKSTAPRKLVVSDAVFSMDGDLAPIPELLALCQEHDALLLLDDAHGFGVLGPQGRGSLAYFGLAAQPPVLQRVLYMATLGKAAGVAGAFVAGNATLVAWLLQKTRSYMFATAPPAMLASAVQAGLLRIEQDDWRRAHLAHLVQHWRQHMPPRLAGTSWRLGDSNTPIQSLLIGPNHEALALMEGLRQRGLWVPAIRPPTVPPGTARLRIAFSAVHSVADVDQLILALGELAQLAQSAQ